MKTTARRTAGCLSGLFSAAILLTAGQAFAAPVSGDPILYWNDRAQALLPGSTPIQSRSMAMVNIAMHDAVNATTGSHSRYYLSGVSAQGGDSRAAASKAARDVLVHLNPANSAQYDAALSASLALIPDGAAKINGLATGASYAAAIVANRAADGASAVVAYTTSGAPGDWRPTPPAVAPPGTPQWGDVTPFLMTSSDQFRSGPPPALGSVEYATDYNEVMALGSITSLARTADQTAAAQFWASGNASQAWIRIALGLAEGEGLSIMENASAFALLSTVMADAQISTFDTKYEYRLWRPITAIREGGADGNALTVGDTAWQSLINAPPFPSYSSAHSLLSAGAAVSLTSIFGSDDAFCFSLAAGQRCFSSVDAAAQDAANSRLWGGIHFRFDNEAGFAAGERLGAYATSQGFFGAVPEPSAWALMIVGFGLSGAMLRRRRTAMPA